MQRKILSIFLLILLTSAALSAESQVNFHSVSLFGFEAAGRYEASMTGSGISLAQELYFSPGKILQAGAGFRYLFARETEGDEQLNWIPVYAALKLFLPVESVPLYAKAAAGYNFVEGNNSAELDKPDLKGGVYFNLGGGVELPFLYTDTVRLSFIFDMGWSSFSASYSAGSSEQSLTYTTIDILGGLGIRF